MHLVVGIQCIALNTYVGDLTVACTHMDGWTELVEPVRVMYIFWHNIWVDCGLVKVKVLFIYIADREASEYSCHFFCSDCFQLAALPLVCSNSFDVPGEYLVELTIGICTQGRI